MKREWPPSIGAATASLFGLMLATMLASDAKTWHWTYVTRTPNTPPVAAQSTFAVSADTVSMAYTVPLEHRQVVIESCKANLSDVQEAATIRAQGTAYLLIHFKPSHSAACASGKRPAVALPANDYQYINRVAAEINRTCCSVARTASPKPRRTAAVVGAASPAATPPSSASAKPALSPTPAASPSPSPASRLNVQDWVESEGLFSFVRIRNSGTASIAVAGDVFDCRNVAGGCGSFAGPGQVAALRTVTVATIASRDRHGLARFRYRYTASDGTNSLSGTASSAKAAPRRAARMSAEELRTAQADAIVGIRSAQSATPPSAPIVPARLIKRGSSRLAIGQTGSALVRLTIAANGTPEEATIVSISNRRLSAAAIETAVSSTYAPATQNGRSVAAKYVATFAFDGEDPALASVPVWKRAPAHPPTAAPSPPPPSPSADSPPAASPSSLPAALPSSSPP